MEIIKKNLLSVICGVIALLAVVLCFFPLGSMKAEAQATLDSRVAVGSSMDRLLKQTRHLPVVDIDNADPQLLTRFPTRTAIDDGKLLKDKMAQQARNVAELVVKINRRALLVAGSLPEPQPAKDFEFRREYLNAVDKGLPGMLQAGSPPTQADIATAMGGDKPVDTVATRKPVPGFAEVQNQEALKERQEREVAFIENRAAHSLIYLSENAITPVGNDMIPRTGQPPKPVGIWNAQLNFWVQTDVAAAILEMNKPYGSVRKAPIKNLIGLKINDYRGAGSIPSAAPSMPSAGSSYGPYGGNMSPYGGGMPGTPPYGGGPRMPGYSGAPTPPVAAPVAGASGAEAGNFSYSLTGRSSTATSVYDVVPFELSVHIEADKLPAFLQQLSKGRLITPLNVTVQALDTATYQATMKVVYGPSPIVVATIFCEDLFLRDWTVPLMPLEVKQKLGIAGPGPAPTLVPPVVAAE